MSLDERRRLELEAGRSDLERLEARVYSRAGADEPHSERIDPSTGRTIWVTESEWRLLAARRARTAPVAAPSAITDAHADDVPPATARPEGSGEGSHRDEPSPAARKARRRRRPAFAATVLGSLFGAGLVGAWLLVADVARQESAVEVVIAPDPTPELDEAEGLPGGDAFDAFRDLALRGGALPGGLNAAFPPDRVSRLVRQSGAMRGTHVYAVVSRDATACLIVRLEPNGLVANCASVERVRSDGLTLRTRIPSDIGSGRDPDGDGVEGDADRTDLLEVEWHADGSFRVARGPE